MARQKGSANFAGTLEVLAGGPLDARSQVPTKADLTVASNFPYPYVGMQVYVLSEGKRYTLKAADVTVLANWEEEGSGSGHTIEDPEGTELTQRDTLQFGGDLEVSDDDENEKTVVAPHELTTEELIEIMSTLPGQPTQGITIDLRENEIVVGKVIEADGTEKTLYQKTISVDTIVSNNDIDCGLIDANIDDVYSMISIIKYTSGVISFLFRVRTVNNPQDAYIDNGHLYILNKNYAGKIIITLQYTKTTS